VPQTVPELEAACDEFDMQMRRQRNGIVHSSGRMRVPLTLAPCVCFIPNADNRYRRTNCWACQYRSKCHSCPEEVLPATKGGVGAELMGTTVTVGGTRHEDCVGVDGQCEMMSEYLLLAVNMGYFERRWFQ
jgi:hypothetical protein